MNFQAVRQGNENKVAMGGILSKWASTTFIPAGTPKQDCEITDASGETQKVTVWQGNEEPIPDNLQGRSLMFKIAAKKKGNYTNYNGFWDSKTAAPPIQTQQAPPRPPQSPNSTYGSKDRLIVTQVVYKALMDKSDSVSKQDLVRDVEMIMEVGTTGDVPF